LKPDIYPSPSPAGLRFLGWKHPGPIEATTFAGIVAGSIGLYQFNLVVPNVAAGDQPIELTVDGVSTGQNMVIVVGQ
jgi:hypothetical protein